MVIAITSLHEVPQSSIYLFQNLQIGLITCIKTLLDSSSELDSLNNSDDFFINLESAAQPF
jgi:hypothetical protein